MTVRELENALEELPGDMQIMTRDVIAYRELIGPVYRTVTHEDAENHADCEGLIGQVIVLI